MKRNKLSVGQKFLLLSISLTLITSAMTVVAEEIYHEKHRPQFHYSPHQQWMNDPNGMVYYEGEYHLFYQYNPYNNIWGPMHWGHAVSKNMLNWEELPIALFPDNHGAIFSGSAVIDWKNTSGFGTTKNPPMVAIFTYHDHLAENLKQKTYQTQGLAYSLDKGRSWTKYEGNPVLTSPDIPDFRDPKVSWYEPGKKWIMTLAVKDRISFYSSKNLKNWTHESDFGQGIGGHGGVWECPDLIKMKVKGTDEEKYVLLVSINPGGPNGGSGTQYFVGDFDGKEFVLETGFSELLASDVDTSPELIKDGIWLDYGTDNYAGVTWADVPATDERKLFIGWMNNWQYANKLPTNRWRGAMTIPRELQLVKAKQGYRVYSVPVAEIENQHELLESNENLVVKKHLDVTKALGLDTVTQRTTLSVDLQKAKVLRVIVENDKDRLIFTIDRNKKQFQLDRSASGIVDFDSMFSQIQLAPLVDDVGMFTMDFFVDESSIEIFVNNGQTVFTSLLFPESPYQRVLLETDDTVLLKSAVGYGIEPLWIK
ncbi:glycoside hydrolase family 32 protein [Cellvibrio sp. PSBB006]|uniref:glycoside hydrolase family 32 protein n=1 Tax=Cellvibrio sp. PSBB006 TaxID=1987723 RepID=UPI000B3B9146|nr:glycoside hydrolase family 32 protein [Cellvibrio sp. PSBB006]ARU26687.1 hypothetical protein CBR65_04165 [Cellvibrio sp. PSBB006]